MSKLESLQLGNFLTFAMFVVAFRGNGTTLEVGSQILTFNCVGNDRIKPTAGEQILKIYPPSDGWFNHQSILAEIKPAIPHGQAEAYLHIWGVFAKRFFNTPQQEVKYGLVTEVTPTQSPTNPDQTGAIKQRLPAIDGWECDVTPVCVELILVNALPPTGLNVN